MFYGVKIKFIPFIISGKIQDLIHWEDDCILLAIRRILNLKFVNSKNMPLFNTQYSRYLFLVGLPVPVGEFELSCLLLTLDSLWRIYFPFELRKAREQTATSCEGCCLLHVDVLWETLVAIGLEPLGFGFFTSVFSPLTFSINLVICFLLII